jgi:transcriptional antiterminator NusG
MSLSWYVVQVYSGFEKSVKRALDERIERGGMRPDSFGDIIVPSETVEEIKGGRRAQSERKFYPGYVFIEMEMNDVTWHLVKDTPKVTGFVGGNGTNPKPLTRFEVDKIRRQLQEGTEKPRPKVLFDVGQIVRIKEGPFTDFQGSVAVVNYEKSRLSVSVSIFGRSTPVELDFSQVEKG